MTTYEPVWITTDEHLESLHSIYRQASLLEKMFGAFRLPPQYPHLQMHRWLLPSKRIPVVAIASGLGTIDNNRFSFRSKPFNLLGSTTKNLLDLEFDISGSELIGVTRASAESPVLQYYNIPFTRIQTRRSGFLGDFLVCVGGAGPSMQRINAQSSELFQGLSNLLNNKNDQHVAA
jgi:hypothetical protein